MAPPAPPHWESLLSSITDPSKRDRWARLRFSIIGPLLAAPPAPRELQAALQALAQKTWRHPVSGLDVRFGVSTLERWYYAARRSADPVGALKNRLRARHRPVSQCDPAGDRNPEHPVSRAPGLDGATAFRQPAHCAQRR